MPLVGTTKRSSEASVIIERPIKDYGKCCNRTKHKTDLVEEMERFHFHASPVSRKKINRCADFHSNSIHVPHIRRKHSKNTPNPNRFKGAVR